MSHGHGCATPANSLMDKSQSTPVTAAAVDVGSGPLLGRDDWKSQVRALIADRNGNNMPDFDEYLESLAEEYYDSALADGLTPEPPQEAVWNEWSAAQ